MSLTNFNENILFLSVTSSFFIEKISTLIGIAIIVYAVNHFEEGLKPLRVFHPKISDACYTEINKKLSAEINKVNSHCTAEIASINARIENFVMEAQSILDRINIIEQIVNDLYEEKKRCEEARIVNQPETAQGQNDTESITSSVQCTF
ncbi:hypothetical protein C1646_723277 [Rhizophagus diaphanus]|nr:hypothetical protein C1646_723277 [Rhizophagus diaphanus] [Rhizophagus sp. MUCL 43196]